LRDHGRRMFWPSRLVEGPDTMLCVLAEGGLAGSLHHEQVRIATLDKLPGTQKGVSCEASFS
jgi:hypothetical protein